MGGSAQSLLLQHQLMMQQQQQQQQQPQQQQQVQQQQLSQQQQFIMGQVLAAEQAVPPIRYQPRTFVEGDFDFLKYLSYEDLGKRMSSLDSEMEREIEELRRRYQAKRQPILDAIDSKKKRQPNF